MKKTAKSIFLKAGLCALALAVLSLWFAACASKAASTGSAGSATGEAKQAASGNASSGTKAKTEELPQIAADIEVFPQLGHTDNVNSVAFSPDGKFIASGSSDRFVKLWDVDSGREIRTFIGHTGGVTTVTFSHDGKYIASNGSDGVKLWDVKSGNEIKTFSGSSRSIAFSPDGKYIASNSRYQTVSLYDIESGNEIRTFSMSSSGGISIGFSPDGKFIFCGSNFGDFGWTFDINKDGKETIKLWEVETGKEINNFTEPSYPVSDFKYSPDGKYIAIVYKMSSKNYFSKDYIKILDAKSGKAIREFDGSTPIAFSPDGKYIVSGFYTLKKDRDGYEYNDFSGVRIFEIESGKEIRKFTGKFSSIAFSPDGKFIISNINHYAIASVSDSGKYIKLWSVENGTEIRSFTKTVSISSGFYSYRIDGKQIWYGKELWDTETGRVISTISVSGKISSNFLYIVYISNEKLTVWDVATGRDICSISGSDLHLLYKLIEFSPDEKYLAVVSDDEKKVKLLDVNTGKEIKTFLGHMYSIKSIQFSHGGNQIIAVGYDHFNNMRMTIWDIVTGNIIKTFYSADEELRNTIKIHFNPDMNKIASGGSLYDIATGQKVRVTQTTRTSTVVSDEVQPKKIRPYSGSLVFSPDGRNYATSVLGKITIWDTESGNEIKKIINNSASVSNMNYSPDGSIIIGSCSDGTVRLWDIDKGKEIVQFISFSGSDSHLATASRGLTVETETASSTIDGEWISITPDSYYQASPRGDRYLNVRVNNTVSGIDAYRSIFYNPDVVQARLQGRPDPASKANVTIQQAAAFIPPTVTIQSPANFSTTNTATANLSVNIASQSQPIKNIKIIVNGRLIGKDELAAVKGTGLQPERASLTVTGNQKTLNLSLPLELEPGNNRIEVVAFNGYSESRRFIDVTRNAPAGEKPPLPNLWIVAVGVNGYDNAGPRLGGLTSLNFAVADAKGLVDSLKAQEGKRYAKVNSILIADGEAQAPTTANIRQGLKFLEGADPRRDIVILFLAGHGISAQESKFFFLPKDAVFSGNRIVDASKAISGDEIMSVLDAPGNRLVFIDACQSGGVDNDCMVRSLMDTNAFVFTASRGNELSYESRELGHGFFTYSVMSALKGAPAALAQGNVSVLSMSGFVKDDVPKKTGGRQNPSAYSLGFYDFPVAVIK